MKRPEADDGSDRPRKRNWRTVAGFNAKVMDRLQKALEKDPSVDLSTIFPQSYQSRRHEIQLEEEEEQQYQVELAMAAASPGHDELRCSDIQDPQKPSISDNSLPQDSAKIVFSLSIAAQNALQLQDGRSEDGEHLATRLKSTLVKGELLCSPTHYTHLVRCNNDLVIKCFMPGLAANGMDFTESTSMQYLERHVPDIPAPRSHGLIVCGKRAYLFMTYVPGKTLESVWPHLTDDQKSRIQNELEDILATLRAHPMPSAMKLGGVQGEGCKDTRRATKVSSKPLKSSTDFWHFVYGSPIGPTAMYKETLQAWFPFTSTEKCVFTHGDFRPANIHVVVDDGQYHIAAILDWEMSGFYPESWEACKATNCISPTDTWDWYFHIPPSASPSRYSHQWLLDRFWDRFIVSQSGIIEVE